MIPLSSGALYQFYKTNEWRQLRELVIHQYDGMCAVTHDRGDVVHHILPINERTVQQPEIALNPYNLILLSRPVHEKIHARKNEPCTKGFHFDRGGNIISDTIPNNELIQLLEQVIHTHKFDSDMFVRIHQLTGV